ncbi:MAG: sugar transferase [Clostridia bacterium]|nr:sugar transferase [Clostridia bacterium]
MYKKGFKRFFDILFSFIILTVSFPFLLIIAIAIKLDSKGPVIFKQKRLGKGGKEFYIYKFRTMVVNAEAGGVYSDNKDPRVTRVGGILRKTSLDELPQMVNVLKGDMSFIGPRPPLTYHPWPLEQYTDEQRRMFDVRPGITGWAQINGRKAVEWNRRIELNVWYIDNLSFVLDCKIVVNTILKVLKNSDNENIGASVTEKPQEENVTAEQNEVINK